MKEIFKKFLPPGRIFASENKQQDSLIEGITKNFSTTEKDILAKISEIPGSLSSQIDRWEEILKLQANGSNAVRNNAVVGKLSSLGGGSLSYLSKVAVTLAGRGIAVTDEKKPLLIEVIGIEMSLLDTFSCSSNCRNILRKFEREESIISGLELIKHAHLGSRYYDTEKVIYAQN